MNPDGALNAERKKTSPWVYVGIGCAVVIGLCVAVAAGLGFWGYRTIKRVESEMKDPVTRESKVKQVLGCTALPDGYTPFLSFSIPWLLDVAILSDKEPTFEKHEKPFDKRGFLYVKSIRGRDHKRARDYFEGKADPHEMLQRSKIDFGEGKEIGRGSFTREDLTLYYIANRGSIHIRGDRMEGITTLMFIECPGDEKFRMGIWFGPEPGEDRAGGTPGEAAYAGTTAYESAIREFMAHFSPCG